MRSVMLMLLLLLPTRVFAQLHGGDVELHVVMGRIVTNQRVYSAELGEIIPNEVDEPGFDSLPGTFPSGSSVGFTILDALRVWDGNDFDSIPIETLAISFGTSLGPITTPLIPSIVAGFNLNVSSDGAWHRHIDFILGAPASMGVYLLQLELTSSSSGIAPTEPFFIVFNQNDSEVNHDAAIAFVENSLTIPEPKSLAIGLGAILAVGVARSKRTSSK